MVVYSESRTSVLTVEWRRDVTDRELDEGRMGNSSRLITELAELLKPIMGFEPLGDLDSYTIGQLSAHLRVSLRTLRFYEQAGLLMPGRAGLRRLYSSEDLLRLEIIVTLRELEVSLTSIRALLGAMDDDGEESRHEVMGQIETILATMAADNVTRIAELEHINGRIGEAQRILGR